MQRAAGFVLGVCNGFQVLTETGLLPGALLRNAGFKYICRTVPLIVGTTDSVYTGGYELGQQIDIPIAHHDGNYTASDEVVAAAGSRGSHCFSLWRQPEWIDRRILPGSCRPTGGCWA